MNLTEKTKTEVLAVYNTWLHSYLNADVATYDSYFDDDFHFIGSTNNEEFLNRKDTTQFFADTGDQFAGKTELRNETKIVEQFGSLVFITHCFDAWFLAEGEWTYYGRFRFSNALRKNKEGWRFVYQHYSIPDSKTEEGDSIGFDKVNEENQQLREAIQRRTTELELKNRELQIESAVDRIRAQAVAMKTPNDLLDIVVTMRNEFIKLGHEAQYFWHMMWLPETYEKAMTSGDGSKIGFVMELPRHIHSEIPILAQWEKSNESTVVYAMDVEAAIDYVDKMVSLGDFKNIDPQAPTEDDIRHIGGLTFIMARTTHGEIGYSLPGVVENPPKEDLNILVKFAGAFDLAHRRFLDLQKAEQQAREIKIELSLERIRSRVTAMQKSSDLFEIVVTMRNEFISLGHQADYFWHMKWLKDTYEMSMTAEDGGRLGMVITVPKFVHDNIPTLAAWEKSAEPTFVLALDADEAWDYIENMNTHGHYQLADPNAPTQEDIQHIGGLTFVIARTTHGEIGFSLAGKVTDPPRASIDILVRFANVFDLAYKRFEDLQKAEKQGRETQIELALEKVRSRTMAMQNGEEIKDVVVLLYKELIALGVTNFVTCGYVEVNETTQRQLTWVTSPGGDSLGLFFLPLTGDAVFDERYDAWKIQQPVFHQSVAGKARKDHLDYAITTFNSKEAEDMVLSQFPDPTVFYCFNFSHGYLHLVGGSRLTHEEEMLMARFTKVFEQTYARFLDLQKAEAQAKEAKIETALEKVRSRSLAMQNSDELKELIGTVYKELNSLDMALDRCLIWIMNDADYSTRLWMANREAEPVSFYVPNHKNPPYRAVIKGWKERNTDWEYHLKGKVKKEWDTFVFENTEMKHFPAKLKEMMQASEQTVMSGSFHSFGCLQTAGPKGLSEEQSSILTRFAKVFNQAYTRFSDLKKAETQAREAEIQLALERVRARTMAMQQSDELIETSELLFQQINKLGITTWSCGYSLWYDDDSYFIGYNPMPDGKMGPKFKIPLTEDVFFKTIRKAKRSGKDFFVFESKGKSLEKTYQYMDKLPVVGEAMRGIVASGFELPKYQVTHCGFFSHGHLMFITHEHYPEAHDIFKRFTKEFEQTYTRFLDLQKAEAQTREAQIEAALERVRSRSLAMHSSEELKDVIQIVYDQMAQLQVPVEHAGFILDYKENDDMHIWLADQNAVFPQITLPYFECAHWDSFREAKKKGQDFFTNQLGFEEKNRFYKDVFEFIPDLPDNVKEHYFECPGLAISTVLLDSVGLYIENYEGIPFSDEENSILMRFGKVFQQTYTRFLDLKKAEAQAREAQIEAALERVRSRSLAMHKTDELQEVVQVVAEELKNTGVILDTGGVVICTYFQDSKDVIHWTAADDPAHPSVSFYLPYFEDELFDEAWTSKNRGDSYFAKEFSFEVKNAFFTHAFEHSDYRQLPDDYKKIILESESHGIAWAWSENSAIMIPNIQGDLPSKEEKEILIRFAKVFEQAFIRFKDLQKAEEQAREAKIEAALERIRSQSMGMQTSKDLSNVTTEMFQQLRQFEGNLFATGIVFCDKHEGHVEQWHSIPNAGMMSPFIVPVDLDYIHQYRYDQWKEGTELFSIEIPSDFIEQHFQDIFNLPSAQKVLKDLENQNTPMPEAPPWEIDYGASFKHGYVLVSSLEHFENAEILPRFAKVFEQTYTRFLDLQKAEAQAREAQIEAALERTRTQSMLMQHSNELDTTSKVFHEQLVLLGIPSEFSYVWLPDTENEKHKFWAAWTEVKKKSEAIKSQSFTYDLDRNEPYTAACFEAWESGIPVHIVPVPPEEVTNFFSIWSELLSGAENLEANNFPEGLYYAEAYMKYGCFGINIRRTLTDAEQDILRRFAVEFERTYTRFLDLKKAEAQAREARIEAALEKVRSRSLAMHKSEELNQVILEIHQKFKDLDISMESRVAVVAVFEKGSKDFNQFIASNDLSNMYVSTPYFKHVVLDDIETAKKEGIDFYSKSYSLQEKNSYFKTLFKISDFGNIKGLAEQEKWVLEQKHYIYSPAFQKNSSIAIADYSGIPLTENEIDIIKRFSKVFEQAFIRFMDLKKAEEQAREAKIEMSLEKVRSRTMAMQHSRELPEAANVLFTEIQTLGIPAWSCGYNILSEDKTSSTCIMSSEGEIQSPFILPLTEHKSLKPWHKAILNNENFFVYEQGGRELEKHYEYMQSLPELKTTFQQFKEADIPLPTFQVNHLAQFTNGFLLFITYERVPEAHDIFQRFAKVFEQTYTRFLDLQKAEAQAHEAKIEASLEKVRTVALTLKKSDDMLEIAKVLYEQLLVLGFNDIRNAIIDIHNDETETFLDYDYSHDMSSAVTEFSFYGDPVIEQQIKKVQSSNDAFFEIELKGKQLDELIKTRIENGEQDDPRLHTTDHLTYNLYSFGNGAIGISNFGILSDAQKKILKRFRNVFTFAYKRYTDLANAEAQAREAKIEAALEKVRNVALGMKQSDDLLEITQALYEQLLDLGFNSIRNAIIDVNNEDEQTFLDYDYSHDMGGTVTLMSYDDDPTLEEQLRDIAKTTDGYSEMVLEGQQLQDLIDMRRKNGEKDDPRLSKTDSVSYILYAFGNGAIGISNFGVLSENQKLILSRFRNVFTFAYQRYTDLAQKEAQAAALLEEKQRLEVTLSDLQATQKQLIQSEKMASLGELTAGIAHEIQNPLNFVNNFSEVSNELIDEIDEELAKGDMDEVKLLLSDIRQNLEKIHHHGNRADAIVKGMLQHSRKSTSEKTPTDINKLTDEYLRLAYHGLRAKDKSFNATLETNFDKKLDLVDVMAQDMGRVILNLITNAFYAINEKKKALNGSEYTPTVCVSTTQKKNFVQISVQDNGHGIPTHVLDKIFQPFFTTKPTGQGTGLGLSMSYDIVTKGHDGELKVKTKKGEGTTFVISIPIKK